MAEGIVSGKRAGVPQPITSIDDSGTERLAVDSKVTGVAEIELSELNDEIAVYGGVDGSETADAATRQIINVDAVGRVRTDSTIQIADADVSTSNPVPVAGATADGAAPTGNPVLVAGSDGTNTQTARTDTTGNVGTYGKSLSSAFSDNLSGTQSFPVAENGSLLTSVPFNYYYDGIANNWDRMRGNAAGGMVIQGPVAHDSVVQGNPVFLGHQAVAHSVSPTDVAVGDISVWWTNRQGVPWVIGGHPNIQTTEYNATTAQTDDAIITIATGSKIIVTSLAVMVDEATTVGVGVRIGFGTASVPALAADGASVSGVLFSHPGIVPGGGVTRGDGSGMLGVGADNEDLRITCDVPTSGALRVVVTHYTVAS